MSKMERRSTRGRQSVDSPAVDSEKPDKPPATTPTPAPKTAPVVPAPAPSKDDKKEKAAHVAVAVASVPVPETAIEDTGATPEAEVVLNRRGMPQRQRKRNRFYFDDEIMITNETPGRKGSKSPLKKVKTEPLDEDELEAASTPSKSPQRRPGRPSKTKDDETPTTTTKSSKFDSNALSAKKAIESAKKVGLKPTPTGRGPGRPPLSAAVIEQRQAAATKTPIVSSSGGSQKFSIRLAGRPSNEYSKKDRSYSTVKDSGKSPSPPKTPTVPPVKIKKEMIDPGSGARGRNEKEHKEPKEKSHQKDKDRDKALEKEKREIKKEKEGRVFASPIKNKRDSSPTFERALNPPLLTPELIIDQQKASQDKKIAQDISLRLRNLLKLPKAHKWVCYEWFYSNIDKVLFEGENDFQICLKESFPQMKARKMTRVEWCKIRRLMGKPRRCSQAFFDEEREELSRRRQKIRMIQQRKVTDFNYKELPDEIPLQLVIGTKVTARLRRPQDGLFTGTIEGVDTSNSTYRITFDRAGLGTHSIPDYEVLSNDTPETVSTSSFALKIPRRSFGGSGFKFNTSAMNEETLSGFPKSPFPVDGMLGGFPIRLLDMIVRLSKLLKAKREKILGLKELNVEAEKLRSYSKVFNDDFRLRYARCVLDLDSMNKEMGMYLDGIQQYCLEVMYQIAPDHGSNQMIVPEHVQETCRQEALLVVDTYNNKQNRNSVHGPKSLALISNLASLLLQIKTLGNGDRNLYELKSIKDTLRDIKASLEGKNIQLFQDRIEIPMNRIQAGLSLGIPNKSFA